MGEARDTARTARGAFRPEDFRALGADCVFETGVLVFHPENISLGPQRVRRALRHPQGLLQEPAAHRRRDLDRPAVFPARRRRPHHRRARGHRAGGQDPDLAAPRRRGGTTPVLFSPVAMAPGGDRGRRRHRPGGHPAARGDHRAGGGGRGGRGGHPRRARPTPWWPAARRASCGTADGHVGAAAARPWWSSPTTRPATCPRCCPRSWRWLEGRGAPFELHLRRRRQHRRHRRRRPAPVLAGRPDTRVLRPRRATGASARRSRPGCAAASLPWVTFLPCDGQIAPRSLDALTATAASAGGGSVVFSVYRDRDDGWDRTLLSAGIRGLIWALFRVPMRSDGPYLFRRELFDPRPAGPRHVLPELRVPHPHAAAAACPPRWWRSPACPVAPGRARARACAASRGWRGIWFRCACGYPWVLQPDGGR